MQRKVLAVLSMPIALLLTYAAVVPLFNFSGPPSDAPAGYRMAHMAGSVLAVLFTFGVLFFWWSWIIRTLWRRGKSRE
ncbi:MAG: hypothetical protein JNM91_01465 [Flavobacteriales bacterium]|nr:hypothetical protein [Flavobacteriales bacterium]